MYINLVGKYTFPHLGRVNVHSLIWKENVCAHIMRGKYKYAYLKGQIYIHISTEQNLLLHWIGRTYKWPYLGFKMKHILQFR